MKKKRVQFCVECGVNHPTLKKHRSYTQLWAESLGISPVDCVLVMTMPIADCEHCRTWVKESMVDGLIAG
jgi:hypothetical protein